MLRKLAVVVSIFFFAPIATHAKPFVVCNDFVEADVSNDGQGLVSIYYTPCGAHEEPIIYPAQTSYLTALIEQGNDTIYYTNNEHLLLHGFNNSPKGSPDGYLQDGVTSYKGANKDTIETIWEPQGPNAFEIIQDVYVVEFPIAGSGQVVYKFSVVNFQNTPLTAQAQYLLDVDLGTSTADNDGAPVTTRYGYLSDLTTSYPPANSVPPYFIATQDPLDSTNFPGLLSEGYCNDSLAPEPMGLMQPSLFAYVSWPDVVVNSTWGFPTSSSITDEALLFQWPSVTADSVMVQAIGSFSYGSPMCSICFGGVLDAMMIHPDHIIWNGSEYVPNHFPVDGIVWSRDTAFAVMGTQTIREPADSAGGPLRIVTPRPSSYTGVTQEHVVRGSDIRGIGASSISWEDSVLDGVLVNCSTDSLYNIAFSVADSLGGTDGCLKGTYVCPIEVDCQERSYTNPVTTILSRMGSYDGSLCNTRCTEVVAFDTGAIRVPVLSVTPDTLTNMRLSVAPNHAGADSTFYDVCVIDSLLNGSATIIVTDTLGNSAVEQYEYCTIPDTLPPTIAISGDSADGFTFYIRDDRPWDRGLDSIHIDTMFNVSLDSVPPNNLMGSYSYVLAGHIINYSLSALICLYAVDEAGNISNDTCVLYAVPEGVTPAQIEPILLSIFSSPVENMASILLSGAPSAEVEIFDVLGREVDHFEMNESYEWETSALPSGTYIVRAVVNGSSDVQTITKRIVKE
jgi:hypothetical protein